MEDSKLKKLRLSYLDVKSDILLTNQLSKICLSGGELIELDLSGLGLIPNQLAEVMGSIEESCTQLQSLNLSYNALSSDINNPHSVKFC